MQSTFEYRRNAVSWWLSKATNARFCALALSKTNEETVASIAEEYGYSGTTSVALHEGFVREASISLELIIKAVIAQNIALEYSDQVQPKIPTTHDLPSLWGQAHLPGLKNEDQYRLLLCKTVLIWSGRYPTPKSDNVWRQEEDSFKKLLDNIEQKEKTLFRKTISFRFEDFDKLFQMANARLSLLLQK